MPKLEILQLGDVPCYRGDTGATSNGLVALAHHCLGLSTLRIHLQADSLVDPPPIGKVASASCVGSTALQRVCALTELEVGKIPVPAGSVLEAALTIARIFPCIQSISSASSDWNEVMDAIHDSRDVVGSSSEEHPSMPRSCFTDTPPGDALENNG